VGNANEPGANAIIGVRDEADEVAGSLAEVMAYDMAVVVERVLR
jgi:uncharacterized protein YbjQ (UPF0145 family)